MSGRQILPTVAGKVHGVVSVDPFAFQCDGCGQLYSGQPAINAAHCVPFNQRYGPGTRHCLPCWAELGWINGYSGWEHVGPERARAHAAEWGWTARYQVAEIAAALGIEVTP